MFLPAAATTDDRQTGKGKRRGYSMLRSTKKRAEWARASECRKGTLGAAAMGERVVQGKASDREREAEQSRQTGVDWYYYCGANRGARKKKRKAISLGMLLPHFPVILTSLPCKRCSLILSSPSLSSGICCSPSLPLVVGAFQYPIFPLTATMSLKSVTFPSDPGNPGGNSRTLSLSC